MANLELIPSFLQIGRVRASQARALFSIPLGIILRLPHGNLQTSAVRLATWMRVVSIPRRRSQQIPARTCADVVIVIRVLAGRIGRAVPITSVVWSAPPVTIRTALP